MGFELYTLLKTYLKTPKTQKINILIAIMENLLDNIEFIPIWSNSGIGSYEFWGFKGYDKGHDYVDEIQWDESLYTDFENDLIREYVIDNFDSIAKRF